jgi:cysteine-rich repeat protein
VFLGYEECDDGNIYSFDGCSNDCALEDVQKGFVCENVTRLNGKVLTQCRFVHEITLALKSLRKLTT